MELKTETRSLYYACFPKLLMNSKNSSQRIHFGSIDFVRDVEEPTMAVNWSAWTHHFKNESQQLFVGLFITESSLKNSVDGLIVGYSCFAAVPLIASIAIASEAFAVFRSIFVAREFFGLM